MNRTQRRANERALAKQNNKALKTIKQVSKIGTAVVLTGGFLMAGTAGGLPTNLATISHSAFMATAQGQDVVTNPTVDNFKLVTEADGSLSIVSTILKNEGQDNPIESMVRSHNLVVDFAPLELALAKVKAESAAQLIVRDSMAKEVLNSTNFLTSETNGVYTFTLKDRTISPFTTLEEFTAWQESVQTLADTENAKLVALRFKVQEAQDALNEATMPKADPSNYGLNLTSYDSPFASQVWMMGSEALKVGDKFPIGSGATAGEITVKNIDGELASFNVHFDTPLTSPLGGRVEYKEVVAPDVSMPTVTGVSSSIQWVEDEPFSVDLLADATASNGAEIDPDTLRLVNPLTNEADQNFTLPGVGEFVIWGNGDSVTFYGEKDYTGEFEITYTVKDSKGKSATGVWKINATGDNSVSYKPSVPTDISKIDLSTPSKFHMLPMMNLQPALNGGNLEIFNTKGQMINADKPTATDDVVHGQMGGKYISPFLLNDNAGNVETLEGASYDPLLQDKVIALESLQYRLPGGEWRATPESTSTVKVQIVGGLGNSEVTPVSHDGRYAAKNDYDLPYMAFTSLTSDNMQALAMEYRWLPKDNGASITDVTQAWADHDASGKGSEGIGQGTVNVAFAERMASYCLNESTTDFKYLSNSEIKLPNGELFDYDNFFMRGATGSGGHNNCAASGVNDSAKGTFGEENVVDVLGNDKNELSFNGFGGMEYFPATNYGWDISSLKLVGADGKPVDSLETKEGKWTVENGKLVFVADKALADKGEEVTSSVSYIVSTIWTGAALNENDEPYRKFMIHHAGNTVQATGVSIVIAGTPSKPEEPIIPEPTDEPTIPTPTDEPTIPTPTDEPTEKPELPTDEPTIPTPTDEPTEIPEPTDEPTEIPEPTDEPTDKPTIPTPDDSTRPTDEPTNDGGGEKITENNDGGGQQIVQKNDGNGADIVVTAVTQVFGIAGVLVTLIASGFGLFRWTRKNKGKH